ncbi:MAG: hypothetical protein ACTSXU_11575, partial [Promethearchaeota archaeon]
MAHPLDQRTLDQVVKNKPLYKFAMDLILVDQGSKKVIENELNQINLNKFLNDMKHVQLDTKERETFERFLRWCLTASFLVNVVKIRDQARESIITPSLLAEFKTCKYFQEIPM